MAANLTTSVYHGAAERADHTSFLELSPPHWAARGLAWAISIVVLLGALA